MLLTVPVLLGATMGTASAGPDDVLYVVVCSSSLSCYFPAATAPIGWLIEEGANLDFVVLSEVPSVATSPASIPMPSDLSNYGQVWVIDFSANADNAPLQMAGFQSIANWYLGQPSTRQNLIADARLLSGLWGTGAANNAQSQFGNPDGSYLDEQVVRNFYTVTRDHGGGLYLGADHAQAFTRGINEINESIGIEPFVGYYHQSPRLSTVDLTSPLMADGAARIVQVDNPYSLAVGTGYLRDDSSTGDAPFGIQPNGQVLYPAAWHHGYLNSRASISSSFNAEGFGEPVCTGADGLTTGSPAGLSAFGSTRVSDNDLTLEVTGLPPAGTVAFLFNSQGSNLVSIVNPVVGGVPSAGTLCIGSTLGFGRHLGSDVFAGSGGTFNINLDLASVPFSGSSGGSTSTQAIQPGETWNWQCWYRDGDQQSGQSNMTDAISIQFSN